MHWLHNQLFYVNMYKLFHCAIILCCITKSRLVVCTMMPILASVVGLTLKGLFTSHIIRVYEGIPLVAARHLKMAGFFNVAAAAAETWMGWQCRLLFYYVVWYLLYSRSGGLESLTNYLGSTFRSVLKSTKILQY